MNQPQYTVVDLSRVLTGPFATMILGDLGFRIIKVEEGRIGDTTRHNPPYTRQVSAYFLAVNRNKESIVLDLKHPEGRAVLLELVKHADVVVENFRPDVMASLGLSFDDLRKVNPRIVLVSINGFGSDGPLRDLVSYDLIAQAMSGSMAATTPDEGEPIKPAIALGDLGAGLFAVVAALTELLRVGDEGAGRHVEVSLHDSMLALSSRVGEALLMADDIRQQPGKPFPNGIYATADGSLALSAYTAKTWAALCQALGQALDQPAWAKANDANDANGPSGAARTQYEQQLTEALRRRSTRDWLEILAAHGVPAAPVRRVPEVLGDPAVRHSMITTLEHPIAGSVEVFGNPIKRQLLPYREQATLPPPRHGEHTLKILEELGYVPERIEAMLESGAAKGLIPEPDV